MKLTFLWLWLVVLALISISSLGSVCPDTDHDAWFDQHPDLMKAVEDCSKQSTFKVEVLSPQSQEFDLIKKYIQAGVKQPSTGPQSFRVWKVERDHESEAFRKWDKYGNRVLLWHGVPQKSLIRTLQGGFRVRETGRKLKPAKFGRGLYFTDTFRKGLQYSSMDSSWEAFKQSEAKPSALKRYVFLCEVSLGNPKVFYERAPVPGVPNKEYQSVKGIGRLGPNPSQSDRLPDGAIVPLGSQITNLKPDGATQERESFKDFLQQKPYWDLHFNEYVVYDPTQILIKYLVEL